MKAVSVRRFLGGWEASRVIVLVLGMFLLGFLEVEMSDSSTPSSCYKCGNCTEVTSGDEGSSGWPETALQTILDQLGATDEVEMYTKSFDTILSLTTAFGGACPSDSADLVDGDLDVDGTPCAMIVFKATKADDNNTYLACTLLGGLEAFFISLENYVDESNNSLTETDYKDMVNAWVGADIEDDFEAAIEVLTFGATLCSSENNCVMLPANDEVTITQDTGLSYTGCLDPDSDEYDQCQDLATATCEQFVAREDCYTCTSSFVSSDTIDRRRQRRSEPTAVIIYVMEFLPLNGLIADDYIEIYTDILATVAADDPDLATLIGTLPDATAEVVEGGEESTTTEASVMALLPSLFTTVVSLVVTSLQF